MHGVTHALLEAVHKTTQRLSPDFDFAANRALCQRLDQRQQTAWRFQRAA